MRNIVLLLLLMISLVSPAQNLLVPGTKSFEKKWVRDDSYEMTWYAFRDTSKIEIGKVSIQIINNRKNVIVVTQINLKNMRGPWIDSTIADAQTLKPVYHSSYNMQRDMVLIFGRIVTGYYKDKTKNSFTLIRDTATIDYFDSNLYPTLIRWLPFRDGYKQDISIYDYNPAGRIGVLKAFVKDVKSGTYETKRSGKRNVWIVTVSDEMGGGQGSTSTYFIDKADRKLWKQQMDAGSGKIALETIEIAH